MADGTYPPYGAGASTAEAAEEKEALTFTTVLANIWLPFRIGGWPFYRRPPFPSAVLAALARQPRNPWSVQPERNRVELTFCDPSYPYRNSRGVMNERARRYLK